MGVIEAMSSYLRNRSHMLCVAAVFLLAPIAVVASSVSWNGTLVDCQGKPVASAVIKLHPSASGHDHTATTAADGKFYFAELVAGEYEVSATVGKKTWNTEISLTIKEGAALNMGLQLPKQGQVLIVSSALASIATANEKSTAPGSGGGHLSSNEVSNLPLNARDFSKLLLLAAGTMTDTNGTANFTQQFAVNGQRGSLTVFAIDGADSTDPEMGGATFSNFNVDAIQEVQGSAGVMPAEIGHGAASYTNVVTKSGTNQIHGSLFEFVRNAAFDARNYFDYPSLADNFRRIPPFVRNEFGFTLGGPVVLPKISSGRERTYFFGEYQGFRQVLGTTQVFPVPTVAERQGIDTQTVPGDTLTVPVNAAIVPVLKQYPLPNDSGGAYGDSTYATSSKVTTTTDQFSIRIDHKISDKASLLTRFSLSQVTGPLTNPDQTAIDPSFAVQFFDHQRSAAVKYTRTISSRFISETELGYIRSTPIFPAANHTQPALIFADGLFDGFNSAGGSLSGTYSNLFQLRHDMSFTRAGHALKWGLEVRFNRDEAIFGADVNGLYSFGGGTAYSPVLIPSASGTHDIHAGDPLPDSLTGLLTATPYSYSTVIASAETPTGDRFDAAAVRREAYEFYFQDAWKVTPRLSVNYGLRYAVNSRIHEAANRTSAPRFVANGQDVPYWDHNAQQQFLYNPQPPYNQDWSGWGPRLAIDYAVTKHTRLHVGGSITAIVPNIWQDNFLTGELPFAVTLYESATPTLALPFHNSPPSITLPPIYSSSGQQLFVNPNNAGVPANTVLNLQRFQSDLEALTPGDETQLLTLQGFAKSFRNGYVGCYTAGFDHDFGDVKFSAAYVATAGVHLSSVYSPNSYGGASPTFAPFTRFDSAGAAIGGRGPEVMMTGASHSSYHSLQATVSKNSSRAGLGLQGSYTYSKALDDTSALLGSPSGTAGVVLQALPQNPWDPQAEKGPSTFDVTHVFNVSVIQLLPLDRIAFLHPLGHTLTKGWQFLNITTLTTGLPFSVYSGLQQTGAGAGGTDRPDQIAQPHFSTNHAVREDYFGLGANNASFFDIPINVPGGTGPNDGRFGTLGRDTFRGPGFHNFDFAMIKDTPFGRRGNAEVGTVEFRAEFFNVFNIVNFGLPSNIVRGSGFGIISKTAGNSRQIQFSLKLIF
jgi:hypothetical protein